MNQLINFLFKSKFKFFAFFLFVEITSLWNFRRDVIEEKRNNILDTLNVGKDPKRNQSLSRNDKDINERFKLNQNKIKDKIQNFV